MPDTVPPSAPAVPPTPPVPLSALLAREDLALRQIAGPRDPGTVIHWAHTSEMADPYPYLLGGELLLTAGVHVPETAGPHEGAHGRPVAGLGSISTTMSPGSWRRAARRSVSDLRPCTTRCRGHWWPPATGTDCRSSRCRRRRPSPVWPGRCGS
ncbi:hypothetical protein GCM10022206_90980 [Streptomyces chiangmaiensis]